MSTNKDLYEILELNRNATQEQIKKNYRRLALRYHPDKQGGKSDKEKKEGEEKFKEVAFAYSILSNEDKKRNYDQYGITDEQQMGGAGFDPTDIFKHFMSGFGSMFGNDDDPFSSFFGSNRSRRANYGPEKGQSIRLQIPVTIQDVMNGITRDIEYDIQIRCKKCKGQGGEGVKTCPHCHGTGMITETHRTGFGIMQNSHPCQYCNGSGKTIDKKCDECNGTGLKKRTVKIHVDIKRGIRNGQQEYYKGKGYESKDPTGENGDLLLEFVYAFDNSRYIIQGNNIYEKISLNYYDAILGGEFTRILPNGDKITYKVKPYSKDGDVVMLSKNYGSLTYNLVITIKMPDKAIDKEIKLLNEIKKLYK